MLLVVPCDSEGNFRFLFYSYGVSSSGHGGGGALEQRSFSLAIAGGILAAAGVMILVQLRQGECRFRAACGAPTDAPRQHGTPQGPERLRCTGPLTARPCINISTHREHNTLCHTLAQCALFINFANLLTCCSNNEMTSLL